MRRAHDMSKASICLSRGVGTGRDPVKGIIERVEGILGIRVFAESMSDSFYAVPART